MKKITTFVILFTTISIFSQKVANYKNLLKKGKFDKYITKQNDTISIGDTLTLGQPTTNFGFKYISQAGERAANFLAGKKIKIHKLKTYGQERNGFVMYIHFKGYGLVPVLIDYENALETGELLGNSKQINKKDAIKELKEAKELLELGVISKDEYETKKKKLSPIILKKH